MQNRIHKIIVLGDSGVGKSTLIQSYSNERYTSSCRATIGVDFCMKNINLNGRIISIKVRDNSKFYSFHKFHSLLQDLGHGWHGTVSVNYRKHVSRLGLLRARLRCDFARIIYKFRNVAYWIPKKYQPNRYCAISLCRDWK